MDEEGIVATPETPEAVDAPVDTAEMKAQRLQSAVAQEVSSTAVHAALLEVIDACGTIRNGLTAGLTEFTVELAHARASLEAAASRLEH